MKLGHIAAKYESGNMGPGVISSGRGDPGGKSYGVFQLALKTGTLKHYVSNSRYRRLFGNTTPGSREFDRKWANLASKYPKEFEADQYQYIARRHYVPVREYADKLGIMDTPAINEVLFSMGVQHGKASTIVWRAKVSKLKSERKVIARLYKERIKYVNGLRSLSPKLKKALHSRYVREERDVVKLLGKGSAKTQKKSLVGFVLAIIVALIAAFFGA